jgi:O-methyltransferase
VSGITIQNVSLTQLIAMGDGLFTAGDMNMARQFYATALARAPASQKQRVRTRLGLTDSHLPRTPLLFRILQEIERNYPQNDAFVSDGMATWLKTLPFAEDARFLELSEKHAGLLPIANWHWNLNTALWAVREAVHVPGDFVELGVFKGHTALFCAEYVGFADVAKRWWLYDTFEGIPADQMEEGWAAPNERLYVNTYTYEEVVGRFAAFPNIDVIKGRVPEVLADRSPNQIAFIHVDLNNTQAEIAALDILFDRVTVGGVILFDDYCWAASRPQHDAENAWFAKRGLQILPLPTGQGVFVKTRA